MTLLKGKHIIKEIEGIRCSVVENGTTKSRVDFLKELLELNGYEVKVDEIPAKEEGADSTYIIGVTSMVFNAVIAVYQRLLLNKEGQKITADYWNQKTAEIEPNYWDIAKK